MCTLKIYSMTLVYNKTCNSNNEMCLPLPALVLTCHASSVVAMQNLQEAGSDMIFYPDSLLLHFAML